MRMQALIHATDATRRISMQRMSLLRISMRMQALVDEETVVKMMKIINMMLK